MNKTEEKINLIIADNQFLIIEALKTILGYQYNINAIVSNTGDLILALRSEVPNILITDYSLLDFNGFDELREIRKMYPLLVIVILTNNITRNELGEFKNLGIQNILHKNADKEELFLCLETALRGKKYYSDIFMDMLFDLNVKKGMTDETSQLTASEIEIVRQIAQGLTTKEIASKKFLSFHTIMTHRKNILRKLGVSNASELIMFAVRTGIIDTIEYHI
jgi:DNA-binding NarL/FixJ family response regulator